MELPYVIRRYSAPSSLDQAPHKTLCMIKLSRDDAYEIYMQIDPNQETPRWESLGLFKNGTHENYIQSSLEKEIKMF